MPDNSESLVQNTLLSSLAKPDFELLRQKLEWADLAIGDVLYEVDRKVDYAYFPISGICSVIAQNAQGVQIETGLIGREGFVGIPIVLFVDSTPSQVVVQAARPRLAHKPRQASQCNSQESCTLSHAAAICAYF